VEGVEEVRKKEGVGVGLLVGLLLGEQRGLLVLALLFAGLQGF
jgi:hypothetical protein